MKHLILALLLSMPAHAHIGEHYHPNAPAPEVSAEQYLDDYLNHGYITCYGKTECLTQWDIKGAQGRMIVPRESQNYFRHPYHNLVTSW